MDIQVKRLYDGYDIADGMRIFVDRLWPRGIQKADFVFDIWAKPLAPSTKIRKEFAHRPENFAQFEMRYKSELDSNAYAHSLVIQLKNRQPEKVTLLYGAKDTKFNNAVILADWLYGQLGQIR